MNPSCSLICKRSLVGSRICTWHVYPISCFSTTKRIRCVFCHSFLRWSSFTHPCLDIFAQTLLSHTQPSFKHTYSAIQWLPLWFMCILSQQTPSLKPWWHVSDLFMLGIPYGGVSQYQDDLGQSGITKGQTSPCT